MTAAKKFLGLVVLLILLIDLKAQTGAQLWGGVQFEKKLPKGFSFQIAPEFRLSNEFSSNKFLIESGLQYKLSKTFSLNAKYRFASETIQSSEYDLEHQLAFDAKAKVKIKRFNVKLRTRLTNYSDYEFDDFVNNPYLRYRLLTSYNIKESKFSPFVGLEVYHQLEDNEFNRLRYIIGCAFKLDKNNAIEFEYNAHNYLKKDYTKNVFSLKYKLKF